MFSFSAFTHAESSTSRDLLVASSTALLPNSSNKHSDYNVTAFYDTTTNSLEASYKESELNSTAVHVYVAGITLHPFFLLLNTVMSPTH